MKKELQEALRRDFPTVFGHRDDPTQPSGWPIVLFGVECGDGWEPLIRRLCEKLEKDGKVVAFQIKEKFGGLRFYVNYGMMTGGVSDEAHEAIRAAEEESFHTCEDCGSTDSVVTEGPGWIRTLCEPCRKTWDSRS